MVREQTIQKIIEDKNISEKQANIFLNQRINSVYCMIALYKYYQWFLENNYEETINWYESDKLMEILESKPYYRKDPVLNIKGSHILLLSQRSLFRQFYRETNCKYNIEQVMFCDTNEIRRLNNFLNKMRG